MVVDHNQVAVSLRPASNSVQRGCPMPITPETVDRLTTSISQLLRTGRHVSVRAAGQLYGELPPFGWGLLIPLERDGDQRCSALAGQVGVDVSVASRQLAVLERLGCV